jgi:hypothetical protein
MFFGVGPARGADSWAKNFLNFRIVSFSFSFSGVDGIFEKEFFRIKLFSTLHLLQWIILENICQKIHAD